MTALQPGLGFLASTVSTLAAAPGEWKYWLPPNYSTHGDAIDTLFKWIFWITTIAFVLVEVTLVVFLIKYRYRPERRKGVFTHGNTRLEMIWTLVPAVILLLIALATKRVWDSYRFSAIREDPNRAQVLVVGEQFKWNFVSPGPDQVLGRYMVFPQPTDARYRTMPREAAMKAIGNYISGTNPLGQVINEKEPADPGRDDDYAKNPGRPLILPADRAIDVNLSAKDVLHDFFLPEFRVKLDAVPGMRGHIYFKGKPEARCTQRMPVEQVPPDKAIWLDPSTPSVQAGGNPRRYRLYDPTDKRTGPTRRFQLDSMESLNEGARRRLLRATPTATPEQIAAALPGEVEKFRADLKAQGINDLSVVQRKFEIVCEELCGMGHATMRGEMYMVSNDEYMHYLNLTARPGAPTPPARPPVADASSPR